MLLLLISMILLFMAIEPWFIAIKIPVKRFGLNCRGHHCEHFFDKLKETPSPCCRCDLCNCL